MESKKREFKKVRLGLKPVRGEHLFPNDFPTPWTARQIMFKLVERDRNGDRSVCRYACLIFSNRNDDDDDLFYNLFLEQATTNRWTIETNSLPFDAGISASFSTISTEFSAISSFGTCCSGAQFAARALNSAIGGQNVFRIKGCSTYLAAFSWAIFPWITAPNVQGRWLSLHQAKK